MSSTVGGRGATGRAMVETIIADYGVALRELRCIGSQRLHRQGISMSHLHLMSMIEQHGDLPMSRVAELLGVSLSNSTGLIDRMEERGLVERVRVPDDRRVVLVRLTDRGRASLDELELLRKDLLRKILDRLSPAQLERLAASVRDVGEAVADVLRSEPDALAHVHPADAAARPRVPATHER